jgi:hypothetical protein
MSEQLTPNIKKLMIHKVSLDAIPKGGGVADGIKFLSDKNKIITTFRESHEWVKKAIQAVRQAGEPNPFKNSTEEEIAGEILRKIEEKRNDRKKSLSK